MTKLHKLGGALLIALALPLSGCEQVGAVLHKAGDMLGAKSGGGAPAGAPGGMPGMQMPTPEVGFIVVHST